VCTYDNNYCGYADSPGKAVVYGSMTREVAVPAGANQLEARVSIPCNGWGEGLHGPAGSSAVISVDSERREEAIAGNMPYHHGSYYRYEYCTTFSSVFSVAGKPKVTLQIEVSNGAILDFQSATLVFSN
jgi:hypothetical protein